MVFFYVRINRLTLSLEALKAFCERFCSWKGKLSGEAVRHVLRHPAARSGYADSTEMVQRLEAYGNVEAIRRSCGLPAAGLCDPIPGQQLACMHRKGKGVSFFFFSVALLLAGKMKILEQTPYG